ncbi:MAG TPA: PaaI family thioesterase [Usitatibacteraceae bacterium]|nr:PaaI family thioesterase [Usitatibacteraceae bacterium]
MPVTGEPRPAFEPADLAYERRTRESFDRQGAMAHLGARLGRVEPGFVEIELAFRPELSQQHGFFHAGIVATIADSAAGYAAYTLFPAQAGVLTVEFKVNLMAPADGERIVAAGHVIRSGRTITVAQFDVHVEKAGRRTHCATGLQTIMRIVGRTGVQG